MGEMAKLLRQTLYRTGVPPGRTIERARERDPGVSRPLKPGERTDDIGANARGARMHARARNNVMKQLNVNLNELATAMDSVQRDMIDWFLDTQTGEVIAVSSDLDDDEELRERIEADAGDRYIHIPGNDSSESYRVMEEFIETMPDAVLQDRLWRAIAGKGAFRRFKDTLLESPTERERWFGFFEQRQRQTAIEWLAQRGIESTWQPPPRRG